MNNFWNGFEKRSKEKKEREKPSVEKAVFQLGAGGLLARAGLDPVTGRVTVYHGTHPDSVQSIMRKGLDPSYGGSGASKTHGSGKFINHSKGKIHVTRIKPIASFFSRFQESGYGKKTTGNGVITANIPMEEYDKFKADPDMQGKYKFVASTTTDPIRKENLKGNRGYYLSRAKDLNKMPRYIMKHPVRFAGGAGLSGLGLYAGYQGLKNIRERVFDK